VASTTVLIFDALITFDREIDRIWKRKFSGASLLFALNRYLYIASSILYFSSTNQDSLEMCKAAYYSLEVIEIAALVVTAMFSAVRVWAIWGRRWLPFMIVLMVSLFVPSANLLSFNGEVTYIPDNPSLFGTCQWTPNMSNTIYPKIATAVRVFALASDLAVVLATWIKTASIRSLIHSTGHRPSLATLLARDGTIYFLILSAFNGAALIVDQTPAVQFNPVLYFVDSITSIMTSHLILNLRDFHVDEPGFEDTCSSCDLSTGVPGNIDASLPYSTSNEAEPIDLVALGNALVLRDQSDSSSRC